MNSLIRFFDFSSWRLQALAGGLRRPRQQKSSNNPANHLRRRCPKMWLPVPNWHTELGSLYFQNGNLIVALEELTIAISINPNYAKPTVTRGLVLFYIKEMDSAEKDFQRPWILMRRIRRSATTMAGSFVRQGKVKESIVHFQRAIKEPFCIRRLK